MSAAIHVGGVPGPSSRRLFHIRLRPTGHSRGVARGDGDCADHGRPGASGGVLSGRTFAPSLWASWHAIEYTTQLRTAV